ncbi:hypothetical protein BJ944DRAFT_250995 [Cunninghamella echinulata]|nr:hypothetical protein BJ944DRAFT_250995 [Cunninghamella echinulata]
MDKSDSSKQQVQILRIKRKRTEEPMDTLLVQHQQFEKKQATLTDKRLRKDNLINKSNLKVTPLALPTIFRFAETVEEHSFKNITEAKKLKERISRRTHLGNRPNTPESIDQKRDQKTKSLQNHAKQARFKVINQNRSQKNSSMPPEVQCSSQKAAEDLFKMYDAIKIENTGPKLIVDEDEEDPGDIMCNFIPMVKEYLTLNDKTEEPEEEDYVYDVYYCDTTNTGQDISGTNIGSLVWFDEETEYLNDDDSDSEPCDEGDEDSNAEDYYQNDYPDEENSDEDYEDQYGYNVSSDDGY